MNLKTVIETALQTGGATYSIETGTSPVDGFLASYFDYEQVKKFSGDNIEEEVKTFVKAYSEELMKPNNYLGIWISNVENNPNLVFIDITKHFSDLEKAIIFGMKNQQIAIYDVIKQDIIELPVPQKTGTATQKDTYIRLKANKLVEDYKSSKSSKNGKSKKDKNQNQKNQASQN